MYPGGPVVGLGTLLFEIQTINIWCPTGLYLVPHAVQPYEITVGRASGDHKGNMSCSSVSPNHPISKEANYILLSIIRWWMESKMRLNTDIDNFC